MTHARVAAVRNTNIAMEPKVDFLTVCLEILRGEFVWIVQKLKMN
ncbi:hypothetical protein HNR44_002344 [Geomicrobium halophilum]|uniref:Uncharacterized protein n=1 Tax=Geomicrobium halophilum TaxID=549000 RepID=A0A841PVK2_9BACL|nr:hypothetical protein [Geomicrobium halophilum]